MIQLYSPYEPSEYSRPDAVTGYRYGVGAELQELSMRPMWNLYWLSDPNVDSLLEDDEAWSAAPPVDMNMLQACGASLNHRLADETLRTLLRTVSAREFVRLVQTNDHQHLPVYHYGGDNWLVIMARRAAGMSRGRPIKIDGVTWANFGRKDSPSVVGSGIILPLRGKTDGNDDQ